MAIGQTKALPVEVVIVDADPAQRRALTGLIATRAVGRFSPRACETASDAIASARSGSGAITIVDIETVGGTAKLAEMTQASGPVIATSARGSLTAAVAAVRAGAVDFLAKPIGAAQLLEKLEAAAAAWRAERQGAPAPQPAAEPTRPGTDFAAFVGRSPAMREIYEHIRRIAPSRAPVFITGQSGTGKELCAEALHAVGPAADRPFVAINCSAIPKDLMESEIFGHVRGAFTGASDNRTGAAELADGGTLFLDEVAEMDQGIQAKLLRFLQSGTIRRVGGSEEKRVDVRVICATNRDPVAEVEAGRFRGDLFYRLHVLPIHLPPLAERREDILPLAETFLSQFSAEEGKHFTGFAPDAAARLLAAPWPGNVRQLQNTIRRIVVLHDGDLVTGAMFPARPGGEAAAGSPPRSPVGEAILPFWQQEKAIIEAALAAFDGNIARAAAALDLSPSTIYRKRQAWSERRSEPGL
jgi:two-component system repressor protein LuxO